MMHAAVQGIQSTGERSFGRGAVVGDKTLIDALVPCADSWTQSAESGDDFKTAFAKGAAAAVEGAKKTEDIVARMGRARVPSAIVVWATLMQARMRWVLFSQSCPSP